MTAIDKLKALLPTQKPQPAKPTSPQKFVGMSKSKMPIKLLQKQDASKITLPKPDFTGFIKPLFPYLYIVRDDLARVIGKDSKSVKMKEEYNDFMEQYFEGKGR